MGSPWDGVPLVQGLGHAVRPGADGAVGDRLPPLCPRAPWCEGFWGGVSPPVGQQAGEPWGHRTGVKSCTDPAPNLPGCLAAHHPASTPGGAPGAPYRSRCFHGKILGTPPPRVLLPSAIPCTASPSTPAQILAFSVASPPEGGPCPATQVRINPRGAHPKNPRPRARCGGAGATLPKPFLSAQWEFGGFVFCFFLSPHPPHHPGPGCLYSFSLPEAEQRGRRRRPSFIHRS